MSRCRHSIIFLTFADCLALPDYPEVGRVNINADGNLDIAIENKMEHKEEDKKQHYLRREFSYSNYQQTYVLPEDIEKDNISAKVDNGVLTITMPKVCREEVRKIQRQIDID